MVWGRGEGAGGPLCHRVHESRDEALCGKASLLGSPSRSLGLGPPVQKTGMGTFQSLGGQTAQSVFCGTFCPQST